MIWRMKQVDRLVAYSTLSAVLATWMLLVGLDAARAFVSEAVDIGKGNYGVGAVALQIILTLPRRGYEWFGNAALIGSLLGMGVLAGSGELTALRAAGMSKLRICLSAGLSLAIATLLVAAMGETVAPAAEQQAQSLALQAKSNNIAIGRRSGGIWARDGDTFINAKTGTTRQVDGVREVRLADVRVFEFTPKGQLQSIAIAESALHRAGEWTMDKVRRTEFGADEAKSTTEAKTQWKSGLDPRMLALSIVQPSYLSVSDLRRNIRYLKRNQQDASSFEMAYWARLLWPFNVLVLVVCALPFAFGTLRSGGIGKRIFIGMVLAIAWYFLQRSFVSIGAVYGLNLAFATALPALLLMSAAFWYFRRAS
ncbi:MAG TPA: LPS export ABC transporter permease LptG [Tahibacter sp.]|uniref:LPS export ABC transporter permease LptG n=1 Tax=Tahibacter sp. TaxID=2056211 RepID=UPI002C971879|nr:LPS export ABC transporter permease LptG [Tahibacter sp.]HSX60421.1 LPS export ABC transporter permease LptG [Tahibacter sp.]